MVLTASALPIIGGHERQFFSAAHPMHLHGHDFAILYQSEYPWYDDFDAHHPRTGFRREFTPDKLNCQNKYINCINPARRDVIMLPAGGFVIIAFKADNPGMSSSSLSQCPSLSFPFFLPLLPSFTL
jgi:Multicopper oxidase